MSAQFTHDYTSLGFQSIRQPARKTDNQSKLVTCRIESPLLSPAEVVAVLLGIAEGEKVACVCEVVDAELLFPTFVVDI